MTGKKSDSYKNHKIILSQIINCDKQIEDAFNKGETIQLIDGEVSRLKDFDWFEVVNRPSKSEPKKQPKEEKEE